MLSVILNFNENPMCYVTGQENGLLIDQHDGLILVAPKKQSVLSSRFCVLS